MPSVGLSGGIVADRNGTPRRLKLPRRDRHEAPPAKSHKILIALSFWGSDRAQANTLARFLADLEPEHCEIADFLLVNRFDCTMPEGLVDYLSRKFNLFTHQSPKIRTGWPDGCNGLFMSAMTFARKGVESGLMPYYKAIFNCEADGGPLSRDWIARLSAAWDDANKKKPVFLAGPLVVLPSEHINANALLSGDLKFLRWLTAGGPTNVVLGGGWDFLLAQTFKRMGWANIPQMRSYWGSPTFSAEQYQAMLDESLIWMHGCKDYSLIEFGRKRLL